MTDNSSLFSDRFSPLKVARRETPHTNHNTRRASFPKLFLLMMAGLAFSAKGAAAFEFCDSQSASGEILWDVQDNGTATIPFSFEAGDAWTPVRNVETATIRGLHQYAGDLAATLISPSATEVILFRLGDGRYGEGASGCSDADFDLTFSDTAPGTDLSVADEGNYCSSGPGINDRSGEGVWGQPYLPNFPVLAGAPALSGTVKTYESEGITGNLLSNFIGDDPVGGNWGLRVEDVYAQDVGTVQEACVDMDFGSVTYDMWVSSNASCSDTLDTGSFNYGDTVYVCYVVSNEATEDFLFQSETNDHGQDLSTELSGAYSAKFGGSATIRTAVRTFTAGVDAALPAGTTTALSGSVTVVGDDTYFAAPETLTTAETVSITVGLPPAVAATNDTPPAINGLDGGTITNVVANDSYDGSTNPTLGTDVTITDPAINPLAQDGTTPLGLDATPAAGGIGFDPATGELTVDPGTTPGTYTYTYEICDVAYPTNCDTAEITVEVSAPPVSAMADTPPAVNGLDGGTITNVVANDSFNGSTNPALGTEVVLTDPAVNPLAQDGTTPLGLDVTPAVGGISFSPATGELTVDPGTTPGTYTYTYEICDAVFPTNCDTAEVTVVVGDAPIAAADDTPPAVNGLDGGTITNVVANDSFNGSTNPALGTDVVLTDPAVNPLAQDGTTPLGLDVTPAVGGINFSPATGELTVDPGTTTGTYTYTYEICDATNPTNCDTAEVTVVVGDAPIAAADDTPPAVNGLDGGTITNVVANDSFNGSTNPALGTDVVLTDPAVNPLAQDGTTPLGLDVTPAVGGISFSPATGELTVDPGTTPGTYTYTYEICDATTPTNCDTAEVTVVVGDAPIATNDTLMPTEPGPVTINPLANDDGLNPLDPTSVQLTGTGAPAGSTLSADGKTLTVPGEGEWSVDPSSGAVTFSPESGYSGSPAPAAYVVSDVDGNMSNEAVLSVTVLPALEIVATDDAPITLNGTTGGTTGVSLLSNDTLGGAAITDPTLVTLSTISLPTPAAGSISVNADGTVSVAAGTTPGTYSFTYEICEVANPVNCATANVELVIGGDADLIPDIEEDLITILEEDFANTLTMQSRTISGYSADALDILRARTPDACEADVNARLAEENILFDVDRAVIKPESNQVLDEIARILNSCPGSAFEVAGHTDSDASDAYNLDLSQRRVTAVLGALTARGVDTSGFVARGYGESQPIASNATEAGKAMNRRVEFHLLDGPMTDMGPCEDSFSLLRAFDANADETGISVDGQFLRDAHDCLTDRRDVFEGSLSFTDTDQGQSQSAINLSFRQERYRGSDSVFGYFVGAYGSQTDVNSSATGEISGLGINAGIYGASRLQSDLFVDYYLGAAAGRHEFDLAFDRSVGTIDATGNYRYLAGFAGAALSGEIDVGDTTLTPRVGFDYVYSPGADVDVVAELGALSDVGGLELDAISGGRLFVELRTDHLVDNGNANLWFNPRLSCYQTIGSLDGTCGIGGSLGIESAVADSALTYALEIDGEWGEDYSLGSVTLSASRRFDLGVLSGDAGLNAHGNARLGASYAVDF